MEKENGFTARPGPAASPEKREAHAAISEVGIYSILIKCLPLWTESEEAWEKGEPKEILDGMLARIRSEPRTIKRSEFVPGQESSPSELEAYFLFKTVRSDPKATHLSDIEVPDASFLPAESIMCLRDGLRTKKFTQAISAAVAKLESESAEDVEVLDAGCGAIPIMGIYAALSSPQVRSTCLELNPHSAAFAKAVVKAFDLEERVEVRNEDATKYVSERRVDLLVSETMNTGLLTEPLSDIMNHLQPQVQANGVVLPDKVETFAASVPEAAFEQSDELVHIYGTPCPKIDTQWVQTGTYTPGQPASPLLADLPGSETPDEKRIVLLSSKVCLGVDSLDIYDSLISMPQPVLSADGGGESKIFVTPEGAGLHVSYIPGTDPNAVAVDETKA